MWGNDDNRRLPSGRLSSDAFDPVKGAGDKHAAHEYPGEILGVSEMVEHVSEIFIGGGWPCFAHFLQPVSGFATMSSWDMP